MAGAVILQTTSNQRLLADLIRILQEASIALG